VPLEVVLISDDKNCLIEKQNILSGVYSVVPVATCNTFSRDIRTAKNFKITGKYPELEIEIESYDIIDFEKCIECGKCFQICPQSCIFDVLSINLDKCNFCGKCVDNCEAGAIDLYRTKVETFIIPFVMTDSQEILKKEKKRASVLGMNETEKLLSMSGEFVVEEIIGHDNNICQYNPKLDYGCKRCLESCDYNAIEIKNNQLIIDPLLCESCGKCVSVCPTGAMQYLPLTDKDFLNRFSKQDLTNKVVVLGSNEYFKKFNIRNRKNTSLDVIQMPLEPKFCNLFHYLYLFSRGVKKVIVVNEQTKNNNQILFANKLIEYLFNLNDFIIPVLPHLSCEKLPVNPLIEMYSNTTFSGRRKVLSSILKFLYKNSDKRNILIDEEYLNIFGEVDVDERTCSVCLACVTHCKIGALSANSLNYSLNHNPSLCIQCGICQKVCPEKSVSMRKGLLLSDDFFEDKILYRDEPVICPSCKKEFGSKKAFETVKTRLIKAGLYEEKGKFMHYCDECRVIKLLGLN
jgi:ferredoxin